MSLIHTCYRITDIDRSVAFYNALGFEEIGRIPIKDEAVNVFMNQPGDGNMPRLELTYNFGVDSYDLGSAAKLDLYRLAWAAPEPVAARARSLMRFCATDRWRLD
jgi:catechol 2,3-dioxygenase-like lactoylglutathione lyase family enzyme